jgi:hypothetical protein
MCEREVFLRGIILIGIGDLQRGRLRVDVIWNRDKRLIARSLPSWSDAASVC